MRPRWVKLLLGLSIALLLLIYHILQNRANVEEFDSPAEFQAVDYPARLDARGMEDVALWDGPGGIGHAEIHSRVPVGTPVRTLGSRRVGGKTWYLVRVSSLADQEGWVSQTYVRR